MQRLVATSARCTGTAKYTPAPHAFPFALFTSKARRRLRARHLSKGRSTDVLGLRLRTRSCLRPLQLRNSQAALAQTVLAPAGISGTICSVFAHTSIDHPIGVHRAQLTLIPKQAFEKPRAKNAFIRKRKPFTPDKRMTRRAYDLGLLIIKNENNPLTLFAAWLQNAFASRFVESARKCLA